MESVALACLLRSLIMHVKAREHKWQEPERIELAMIILSLKVVLSPVHPGQDIMICCQLSPGKPPVVCMQGRTLPAAVVGSRFRGDPTKRPEAIQKKAFRTQQS